MKKLINFLPALVVHLLCSIPSGAQITPSAPINYSNKSNIVIENKSFSAVSGNSASIYLNSCSNVIIRNCTFINIPLEIGVQLLNCSNIEITDCSFEKFRSGVYAQTSSGINVHCNSFKTIIGPKPRGQMVQFNTCSGTGNRINYNILDHVLGTGDPEDLINMYASSGTTADPIQIIGNQLRGGGPSASGGGIMLGDNGGHDIRIEDNILVNPGQYGIGCPAGYNITIKNNKVYGKQQSFTNVGIYVGLQGEIDAGFACTASTIRLENNQVNWFRKDGVKNGFWNCSCCAGIISTGNNWNASFTETILPTSLSLNSTNCSPTPIIPSPNYDCVTSLPNGYQSVICQNYETNQKAADYLAKNVWYFYSGNNGNATSNTNPELDKRFKIVQDPLNNSNKAIELIKFDGDVDYSNTNLNPRAELSYRPSFERSTSKEIYFRIKTYFPKSQIGVFSAEFIQFWLHGTEDIPLQLEVRDGVFGARIPRTGGYNSAPFTGKTMSSYAEKWILWEIKAKFNKNNGYWKIYMNGELVHTHTNSISTWPDDSGTWHPQYGAYANNGGAGTMDLLFDDFMIAELANTTPVKPEITSLKLINATDESVVIGYENLIGKSTIDKTNLNVLNYNIYAETKAIVDSVVFTHTHNGVTTRKKEAVSPYALKGDGAAYTIWNLPLGNHLLDVVAYKGGVSSLTNKLNFTVINNSITATNAANSEQLLELFPNPVNDLLHLSYVSNWELKSMDGKIVKKGNSDSVEMSTCTKGLYLIEINGIHYKIVKD